MAVTALILGFLPAPQISLHDALVVFYLLFLSWVTVCFSLTACAKFPSSAESTREKHQVKIKIICLHIFSIIQSYTIFAFALAVLITAKTFGNNPDCNPNAVVVLFRPFSALKSGRIVCWVFIVLVVLLYTAILIWDYFPPVPQPVRDWIKKRVTKRAPDPESPDIQPERPPQEDAPGITRRRTTLASKDPVDPRARGPQPSTYDLQIPWELIIKIILVVVVWSLTVMNIELLIRWNNFSPSGGQPWQFGQVLPLFLIVLPLVSLVNAFREPPPRPPKMPPSYV